MKKSIVGIFVLAILATATSAPYATQALTATQAHPSNNLVNTKAWYEIILTTGTIATIAKVDVTFPAGTNIANSVLAERSGINPGSTTRSGQTITHNVASPVSVASGTVIRLEYDNILNPPTANPSLTVLVTTKDSGGVTIESGTSLAYAIKQIGTGDIANNVISSAKIQDGQVGPGDIANNAISSAKIQDGQVGPGDIASNAITAANIVNEKILTEDLANGVVTTSKIAPGAVMPQVREALSEIRGVLPGTFGGAIADCLPGELATGGGHAVTGYGDVSVIMSRRNSASEGWLVQVYNTGTISQTVQAFALCLSLVP